MAVIRIAVVHVAHAADAFDAAEGRCTWAGCTRTLGGARDVRVSAEGAEAYPITIGAGHRLYVWPLPEGGPDAYAVVCGTHFDKLRSEQAKAAEAHAGQLAATTQDTLF